MSRRANAQVASDFSHESGTRRIDYVSSQPTFNHDEWEAAKQASRDQDVEDLRTGRKTREQLWAENSAMLASWKPDFKRAPRL